MAVQEESEYTEKYFVSDASTTWNRTALRDDATQNDTRQPAAAGVGVIVEK